MKRLNATFKVLPNGHIVMAHISGKLRMHYIRISGDRVTVGFSLRPHKRQDYLALKIGQRT